MRTLDLVLKAKWYDMIESGVKTEEYREEKPYWVNRLMWKRYEYGVPSYVFKNYSHVRFRYGYTSRSMMFEIEKMTIGVGNPEWGAPKDKSVFIIKLGKKCDSRMFFHEKYFLDNGGEKD